MKTLVIGGNGFLGRHLAAACIDSGWETDIVYHRDTACIPRGYGALIPSSSVSDCPDEYDVVFLIASAITHSVAPESLASLQNSNVRLPLRAVERFRNARLIFASSVSVYGVHTGEIQEHSAFHQPNLYGHSKLAGEFIVRTHLNSAVIRFSSLYGRGMSTTTFLPRIVAAAKDIGVITLYGDGSRRQDYLHVSDAVAYCMSAAEIESRAVEGDAYLGAYGRSYSNREVAAMASALVSGCKVEFAGEDTSPSFVYNNRWTQEMLGVRPACPMENGIQDLLWQS